MVRILSARALKDYTIWIRYSDGVEGEVDLSHLVGKGVFSIWEDPNVFQMLQVENGRFITWTEGADLCADSLYLDMTGKSPGDIFPRLKVDSTDA